MSGNESLEEMTKRFKEMEEEANKLKEMQSQVEKGLEDPSHAEKQEIDSRSIYIGNVDYSTTPEDLQLHFQSAGTIKRVTIMCDKQGHPKGYAYIEFQSADSIKNSLALNETIFKGRVLSVTPKRTNVPFFMRGGRGRGARRARGRGRGFRGRGRGFQPY